jgi:Phage tail assembly chaperone proteins, E, or 41 or 14
MSDQPAPQQPVGFDGNNTVWLAEPVLAYGDKINKLVFRRPKGKDERACGSPINLQGDININSVFKLAARLAEVPDSTIDELDSADLIAVKMAVLSFFTPAESPATSSIDTTMSPGAGGSIQKPFSNSTTPISLPLRDRQSA